MLGAMATVFDKILSGEIPSWCVYEDAFVYAFLDVHPLARGHTLLIPREPKAFLHELSEESAVALGRALPRVARAVLAGTGAEHYNVLQNNGAPAHQAVFHVHFHIIPRIGDCGLGIGWKPQALRESDAQELLEKMQQALRADGA